VGAGSIDFISQLSDTAYTLSWQPMNAEISKSGDLGFTYGVYELSIKDSVYKGTYVSIWKKQNDGSWKFVLDSGNEGIHN
jgi:ketosteroid isomerase-like protein